MGTPEQAASASPALRAPRPAIAAALALLAGALALVGTRWIVRSSPPPPRLGALPDFRLTERSGRPVGLADLRGTPWVADFIFTQCAGACPAMTARMARL